GWSSSSPGRAAARRLRASMKCASSRPRTSRFTHDSNADRAASAPGGIGQRDFPRRRCSAPGVAEKCAVTSITGEKMTAGLRKVLLIWVQSALKAAPSDGQPAMQGHASRLLALDLERLAVELQADRREET